MKTKVKKLLDAIKKNNGRGVAVFFNKEKDISQLDDIVKIKLPNNFVYSFHGTTIEKVKDKEKSYHLKGSYYESDQNKGTIKIKLSLNEPSKIFSKMSENGWKVISILVDKDSIGIIATDVNANLISLVEKNTIKKIKEKKIKPIVPENKNPDHAEEEQHYPMADINKPTLNLIRVKEIVMAQKAARQLKSDQKITRKPSVRQKNINNDKTENPN